MTKLEKVIKALELCTTTEELCENACPYYVSEEYGCEMLEMKKDALEMLKEQQKIIEDKQDMIEILEDQVSMLQEQD